MFGKSKQAYYKHREVSFSEIAKEQFVVEFVQEIRSRCPGIGGKKLWLKYIDEFGSIYGLGRDRFYRVLSTRNLLLRKRSKSCRTTDSRHNLPRYPDLTKDLLVTRYNEVWVSDITYIRMGDKFSFLSLITDVYSRKIVGWSVGPSLETRYPLEALEMALSGRKEGDQKLIHHSDRGCQYASFLYTEKLKKNQITISMTESGNPKDNAIAERVNGILKREFLNFHKFTHIDQVKSCVAQAVNFYNNERYHSSIDMLTPNQASEKTGALRKHWKSYKDIYRIPAIGYLPV